MECLCRRFTMKNTSEEAAAMRLQPVLELVAAGQTLFAPTLVNHGLRANRLRKK